MKFDTYRTLLSAKDSGYRHRLIERTKLRLGRDIENLPECKDVLLNGRQCKLVVTEQDDLTKRDIFSLVGESFTRGDYVYWNDCYWLITEQSVDKEVYTKGEMSQCNYLLKWIGSHGQIVERHCCIEEAPSYKAGTSQNQYLRLPIMEKSIVLPYDDETGCLKRGARFIIDYDPFTDIPNCYQIHDVDTVTRNYGADNAIVTITLEETQFNPDVDNAELKIADYYTKYKEPPIKDEAINCEIKFDGSATLNTAAKKCTARFFDFKDDPVDAIPVWEVTDEDGADTELAEIIANDGSSIYLKRTGGFGDTGKHVKFTLRDSENRCSDSVTFKLG